MHNRCLPSCSDSECWCAVEGVLPRHCYQCLGIATSPCFRLVSVEGINLAGSYVDGIGSEPSVHLILLSSLSLP